MLKCNLCGNKMSDDLLFCEACGSGLEIASENMEK